MKTAVLVLVVLCLGACKQKMIDEDGADCADLKVEALRDDSAKARSKFMKFAANDPLRANAEADFMSKGRLLIEEDRLLSTCHPEVADK